MSKFSIVTTVTCSQVTRNKHETPIYAFFPTTMEYEGLTKQQNDGSRYSNEESYGGHTTIGIDVRDIQQDSEIRSSRLE